MQDTEVESDNLKIPPSCLISLERDNSVMHSTRSLIHRSKLSLAATLLVVPGGRSFAINTTGNQFLPNVYH